MAGISAVEDAKKALQDADLYAQQSEKVKSTLDDWRAGKITSLSEAIREKLNLGPYAEAASVCTQLSRLPLETEAATSTSFGRYLHGLPCRPGQSLATVNELGLPLHQDPSDEDDLFDQDDSPPLGTMPVLHRGITRPAMLPQKARVLSRPGRGPMPVPISVHPQSRPFGVAQSSLAIREAAQLRARDPTARQLMSRRHAPSRLEPPPKPEPRLPEGFEMPDKLPSPETAEVLLAQANRASERFVNLPKQRQHASAYTSPAVLGADAAQAGTAADFIKDHPLINPRARARPGAAPQDNAATTTSVAAPKADLGLPTALAHRPAVEQEPAQLVSSSAQTLPQGVPRAVALPADSASSSSAAADHAAGPSLDDWVSATSTAAEGIAAAPGHADDESSLAAGLQYGRAIKQRPGQKQRKRQREVAELRKAEDDAKADAEAEARKKAEAEAKVKAAEANAKAVEEAARAEAAAAAEARAKELEDARVKEADARVKEADAAKLKAEAVSLKAAEELLAAEEAAVQGNRSSLAVVAFIPQLHTMAVCHTCMCNTHVD